MGESATTSEREVLAGLVERVTFHNAENGFCVLRVKARAHRDLVTVIGHSATISAGEWLTASGQWFNDHSHGLQFKAQYLKTWAPTSIVSVQRATSGSFEVPGQERIDIFVWPSLSDAFEGLRKPSVRIYIV